MEDDTQLDSVHRCEEDLAENNAKGQDPEVALLQLGSNLRSELATGKTS